MWCSDWWSISLSFRTHIQGFILGPNLFLLMLPVGHIIGQHDVPFHFMLMIHIFTSTLTQRTPAACLFYIIVSLTSGGELPKTSSWRQKFTSQVLIPACFFITYTDSCSHFNEHVDFKTIFYAFVRSCFSYLDLCADAKPLAFFFFLICTIFYVKF